MGRQPPPRRGLIPADRISDCRLRVYELAEQVDRYAGTLDAVSLEERSVMVNRMTLAAGMMLGLLEALVILAPDEAERPRQVAEAAITRIEAARRGTDPGPSTA